VDLDDEEKFVHFVFGKFLEANADECDTHVVTIWHALVELCCMGCRELAHNGVPAYWQSVREGHTGDDESGGKVAPALPREPTLLTRGY
jgi:hypothetical protein